MKRVNLQIKIMLTMMLALGMSAFTHKAAAQFSGGNGSSGEPYIITTPADLAQLAQYCYLSNTNYSTKCYKLNNDINLSVYGSTWIPIGIYNPVDPSLNYFFQGVFDGNNKTISNVAMNSAFLYNAGLFGYVKNGTIKNLNVVNASIENAYQSGAIYAGAIAGRIESGTISNCTSTGVVKSTSNAYSDCIGGVVGHMLNSTVLECQSTCSVNVLCQNYAFAGGIVGRQEGGNVSNCATNTVISCDSYACDSFAGGIVGSNVGGNISNCYSTGATVCQNTLGLSGYRACAGGVVGVKRAGNITYCYSTGAVKVTTGYDSYAGGIAGSLEEGVALSNCFSLGQINATGKYYVLASGVGQILNNSSVTRCYATGAIQAVSQYYDAYVGGITAYLDGSVSNCAALNSKLSASSPTYMAYSRVAVYTSNYTLLNNVGFKHMIDPYGNTVWDPSAVGSAKPYGADISGGEINADGTIGNRFTSSTGWITQNGKLPGLFGNLVAMPSHLTAQPPHITTIFLPNGVVGTPYNQTLTADGDTPITWSLASGNLPNGLSLSTGGVISGTPTTAGTFNFTVKAANSAGSDTKALEITVGTAATAPIITTTTLPNGTVNTAYNAPLAATGTATITWSLASGNLPNGLSLSSNGVISGTPSVAGTFNFTVKATNSAGSDTQILTIIIEGGVGVDELQVTSCELRVYPNPTNGQLTIDNGELIIDNGELTMDNVKIYDMMGRTLNNCQFSIVNSQLNTDISHFPAGVYFLRMGDKTAKVIKID